jgi:glutamate-1-semialdehyde aminotransferase
VFFPASPFEASFLSTAHDDAVIDFTIEQVQQAMQEALS